MAKPQRPVDDRRVQRTQASLQAALGALIREKPYDAIVVREILDRANVGRSTFYAHFRDKDELLVSGIRALLAPGLAGGPDDRILGFSLPVFEHVHRHRREAAALAPRGMAAVHERLQRIVSERIAGDVRRHVQAVRGQDARIPPDLLVQHIAATFILVLTWWAESCNPLAPKEADALFRALVMPALAAELPVPPGAAQVNHNRPAPPTHEAQRPKTDY